MWIMSKIGFFSLVCEHADPLYPGKGSVRETIIVRARTHAHLEALRETVREALEKLPDDGNAANAVLADLLRPVQQADIIAGGGTDYPFRIKIPQTSVAALVGLLSTQIDYDNFKSAVPEPAYHDALMGVWSCMMRLTTAKTLARARPRKQ